MTNATHSPSGPHRVVVVGGGFAGLRAVRSLRGAPVEVTLVDRQNFTLFQPLVYQVATGALSPAEIAAPLRSILRKQRNARVVLAEATGFDLEHREVVLEHLPNQGGSTTLGYDTLIVAGGSRYNYFGHDEWRADAPELKSLAGALDIRSRILAAFEAAELEPDPQLRQAWLTFVVVGAGPTGVEMAGQIAELARDVVRADFRSADTRAARVLLVEASDRVLTNFPASLSQKATSALERLGVTPLLNHTVVDVADDSVAIRGPDGEVAQTPARTAIWAAGVTASELAARLAEAAGAEVDRSGRVTVEPDLSLPGHPEVLALGDMVRVRATDGTHRTVARTGTGRPAAGSVCRPAGPRPAARPSDQAVPLRRQGRPGDDRPLEGRRRREGTAPVRVHRLGDLAGRAPLLPDRLPEPSAGADPLDGQLRHPRPRGAADRPAAGAPHQPRHCGSSARRAEPSGCDNRYTPARARC